MPQLDVSDAILCAEFIDSFQVIRRQQLVSSSGLLTTMPTTLSAQGVVCIASPDDMERFPEITFQHRCISVVTLFRLMSAQTNLGVTYQPDLIVWQGNQFIVRAIEPYNRYGRGFIEAIAESIDYVPGATP